MKAIGGSNKCCNRDNEGLIMWTRARAITCVPGAGLLSSHFSICFLKIFVVVNCEHAMLPCSC